MVGSGEESLPSDPGSEFRVSRGTIVNRIYGTHEKLHIPLSLLTIFGPVYYAPPVIIGRREREHRGEDSEWDGKTDTRTHARASVVNM